MATFEPALNAQGVLARRLQAAHRWSMLEYTRAVGRECPDTQAVWNEVGDGLTLFSGASAYSFATGLGLTAEITASELDAVEDFFLTRGVAPAVEVCPYSSASLRRLLEARQYAAREITHVLYRDLKDYSEGAAAGTASEVQLHWARAEEVDFLVDLMARFLYEKDPGRRGRARLRAQLSVPDSLNAVAAIDGIPVGAAGGMLPRAGSGIAVLFCSATLPGFRRRGVHAALLKFRLRRACQHGCSGAMVVAIPGGAAERNLERHGFRIVYEKRMYVKPPTTTGLLARAGSKV